MNRCETCRHWDRPEIEGRAGQCQRIEPLDPTQASDRKKLRHERALILVDPCYSWLQTRADFGCVLHEEA